MTPAIDPSAQQPAEFTADAGLFRRTLQGLVFLAACLPFLQTARFPPFAGFWHEATAAALYLLCGALALLLRPLAATRSRQPVTVFGAALAWAATVIVAQAAAGRVLYPTEALIAASIVVLALYVHVGALALRAHAAVLMRAWAAGLLTAVLLNAAAVVLRFTGWEVIGLELVPASDYPRPIGLVGQSNHLGVLGVTGLFCAVFLRASAGLPRLPFWCFVVVGSALCAASGSRAALLVAFCSAVALLYCLRSRREHVPTMLIGLGLFVAIQAAWTGWARWGAESPSAGGISAMRTETFGRVEMLRDAWQLLQLHPWFGVGWGNFAGARLFELGGSLPTAGATHAHNFFAQVFAEYGLLGGAPLALAALAVPMLAIGRARREGTPESLLVAGVAVATFVFGLVEHPLWFTYFLLAVAWLLGLGAPEGAGAPRWAFGTPTRSLAATLAIAFALLLVAVSRDYARIQDVTTRLYNAVGMNRPERMPGAAERVAMLEGNLLPKLPEMLLLRMMSVDTMLVKDKLEFAERAVRSIPNPETVIHYTLFLTLAKKHDEGHRFLAPLRTRNERLYTLTVEALGRVANLDIELARLARLHGLDVPDPPVPSLPAALEAEGSPRR